MHRMRNAPECFRKFQFGREVVNRIDAREEQGLCVAGLQGLSEIDQSHARNSWPKCIQKGCGAFSVTEFHI